MPEELLKFLERTADVKAPLHAFQRGDTVWVTSQGLFGRPFIEGAATVVEPVAGVHDCYWLKFKGEEHRIRERYAFPGEWQRDPEGVLAILLDSWKAGMPPEILAEFFPDDC